MLGALPMQASPLDAEILLSLPSIHRLWSQGSVEIPRMCPIIHGLRSRAPLMCSASESLEPHQEPPQMCRHSGRIPYLAGIPFTCLREPLWPHGPPSYQFDRSVAAPCPICAPNIRWGHASQLLHNLLEHCLQLHSDPI